MEFKRRKRLSTEEYTRGILDGDKIILSRALTLIESSLKEDMLLAQPVLENIIPYTGKSLRIGITGVPGVGKSTFIETFGKFITGLNKKLAVLAIDPSSQKTRGSILGDKTRMNELSNDPLAFIRPSPAGTSLGGVSNKTRESMLLCEAAGYEVILIETVGVGQSETAVKNMVDFFLLLMIAGAGDELQGIKKGIMEMADAVVINKADGRNRKQVIQAQADYQNALNLFQLSESFWKPKVLKCSALLGEGIGEIWSMICKFQEHVKSNGFFYKNRERQNLNWFYDNLRQGLEQNFFSFEPIKEKLKLLENKVMLGQVPATVAARELIEFYFSKILK